MAQNAENKRKNSFMARLTRGLSRKPGEADDSDAFEPEAYDPAKHGPGALGKDGGGTGDTDPAPPDHAPTFSMATSSAAHHGAPHAASFAGFSPDGAGPLDPSIGVSGQLQKGSENLLFFDDELARTAKDLQKKIIEREGGGRTHIALFIRIFIGAFWLMIAGMLSSAVLKAKAAQQLDISVFGRAMPIEDALTLERLFQSIGLPGALGAVVFGVFITLLGRGDNEAIKQAAGRLGDLLAERAGNFDAALARWRVEMDQHRANLPNAVFCLSGAHISAIQASSFFREVSFLFEGAETHDSRHVHNPRRHLAEFLQTNSREAPPARRVGVMVFLSGLMIGILAGMLFVIGSVTGGGGASVAPSWSIFSYGWTVAAIGAPALLYLTAGVLVEALTPREGAFESAALDDAVAVIRSRMTGYDTPRRAEVIRRIEDAIDVFSERYAKGGGAIAKSASVSRTASTATAPEPHFADDETPDWRKPPERPRFVETGFSATPKTFRADPHFAETSDAAGAARRRGKSFFRRGPEAKRRP